MDTIQLQQGSRDQGRLDKVLSHYFPDLSRSALQKLIKDQLVKVNGQNVKANFKLKGTELIQINFPDQLEDDQEIIEIIPQKINLDIIYEDESLLLINKPAGMVVHPSVDHLKDTLVNGLVYYLGDQLSTVNEAYRPGIVHRIDKDTSGIIVVAKTDSVHKFLSDQLIDQKMGRRYLALVHGQVKEDSGKIDLPLKRDPSNRLRWHVDQSGKSAISHFKRLKVWDNVSLLEVALETGRTHQIRVHLEAVGHPIIGDPTYRRNLQNISGPFIHLKSGQMLHAKAVEFIHPKTKEEVHFEAPIPLKMQNLINSLK